MRGLLALTTMAHLVQLVVAVFIPNFAPHLDQNGHPIDAHDGRIVQWFPGGEYYWYGMGYGGCMIDTTGATCAGVFDLVQSMPCGFQMNHSINIFSSPDLLVWTFRGEVLPQVQEVGGINVSRPVGIYFRPKVIFHPTRNKYILWVNHLPVLSTDVNVISVYPSAVYVVAEADSPVGPFTVLTKKANVQIDGPGDFDILVDGDNAYLAYTSFTNNHQIFIEQLNADFTDIAQPVQYVGPIGPMDVEAPAFFKYGSHYYLTFGHTCCFCYQGSEVFVYISDSPLGPWNYSGLDIAMAAGSNGVSRLRAQQAGVFNYAGPNGNVLIWTGDQWGLSSDGTKGHVFQYWVPITWQDGPLPLPEALQVVAGFDPDAPLNLQPFHTGFCDKTEVDSLSQVLSELAACTNATCYQRVLSNITPDCAQCIISRQDPSMIFQKCIPPDYKMPTFGSSCSTAEAIPVIQLLAVCPVVSECLDQATALLGTFSPQCGSCILASQNSAFDLKKILPCFPAGLLQQLMTENTSNASTNENPGPHPSSSRSPSRSPRPSRSPSRSPRPSRSPSRSPRPSRSPSRSPKPSRSPSRSPRPSRSPSRSPRPSRSPSISPRPSHSPSPSPGTSRSPSPRLTSPDYLNQMGKMSKNTASINDADQIAMTTSHTSVTSTAYSSLDSRRQDSAETIPYFPVTVWALFGVLSLVFVPAAIGLVWRWNYPTRPKSQTMPPSSLHPDATVLLDSAADREIKSLPSSLAPFSV